MKRILVVVLSVCFLAGFGISPAFADDSKVPASQELKVAKQALSVAKIRHTAAIHAYANMYRKIADAYDNPPADQEFWIYLEFLKAKQRSIEEDIIASSEQLHEATLAVKLLTAKK